MADPVPETEVLLQAAEAGHRSAVVSLLDRHRDRLRRVVASRLDRRLAARFDASDIVQETLIDADRQFATYLRDRKLSYFNWLIGLAWSRTTRLFQTHVVVEKRSVRREQAVGRRPGLDSTEVHRFDEADAKATDPGVAAIAREDRDRIRAALAQLPRLERAVLVLRFVEMLPFKEIAVREKTTLSAVKMRHLRALDRLQRILERDGQRSGTR